MPIDSIITPNKEMEIFFINREKYHRLLVKKNLLKMQGHLGLSLELLNEVAMRHDQSKFTEPERTAYMWMSWMYHCKNSSILFQYPEGVEAVVLEGWQQHIHSNAHHPEAHSHLDLMSELDILEMVCDWTAISQENNINNGSCMEWAILNIDKKWCFSTMKKDQIFAIIRELDRRNDI